MLGRGPLLLLALGESGGLEGVDKTLDGFK